jgi:CRP-like cAMP-binding protein
MNPLFDYISKRVKINSGSKKLISSIAKRLENKKGTQLIKPNQLVNKTYFVLKGCIRSFTYDKDGKEHTLQFAVKDDWISDYIAIFNNEMSTQTIECVSDCIVIEVSINEGIETLFSKLPEIETLHRKNLQRHIVSLQKRILNQLQLSSIERYVLFQKQYPSVEKYALNYHIASYLGITQQSLSRIRSEKLLK